MRKSATWIRNSERTLKFWSAHTHTHKHTHGGGVGREGENSTNQIKSTLERMTDRRRRRKNIKD
jgi:hypothetical protein